MSGLVLGPASKMFRDPILGGIDRWSGQVLGPASKMFRDPILGGIDR